MKAWDYIRGVSRFLMLRFSGSPLHDQTNNLLVAMSAVGVDWTFAAHSKFQFSSIASGQRYGYAARTQDTITAAEQLGDNVTMQEADGVPA